MIEFFVFFWIFLYWGDVAFTVKNFNLIKKLNPNAKFSDYEKNAIAIFLVNCLGFAGASLCLFCVVLVAILFLYVFGLPLLIVGFILGMYFLIYILHLLSYFRIKKRLNLKNKKLY